MQLLQVLPKGLVKEFTSWYTSEMQKTIDELHEAGYRFSCFIADSIFSSDGVHPNPVGFLKAVVEVRSGDLHDMGLYRI